MIAADWGDVAQALRASELTESFDAEKALAYVDRLSFPRRAGTPGERRAARYILRGFSAVGLDGRREPFRVPHRAREAGVRLIFAACAVAVVLGAWLGASRPLVAAACWALAAVLVNAPWRLARDLASRFPTRMTSENLVAALPGGEADAAPARVVFLAHYDTKSQALPTGLRVALVAAATSFGLLLAAVALLAAAGAPALLRSPGPPAVSAALVAILAILAANWTGNRSPGALDNATGVAALMELARTWRPRPGAPVEVLWVATGSEELGLDGARHFLRLHGRWLRQKPTLVINLDSVGAGRRLYLAGAPQALSLARATAEEFGLRWSRLRVLGAAMDHEPFAAGGLAALSVLGDVVGKSMVFHSSRDVPSLVDRDALDRAGRLAGEIAWAWAERHGDHEVRDQGPAITTLRRPRRRAARPPGRTRAPRREAQPRGSRSG